MPVAAPRTKLLARKARTAGNDESSVLSSHNPECGSQGTAMRTKPTSIQKATKTIIMVRAIQTGSGTSWSSALAIGTAMAGAGNERTLEGTEGSLAAADWPSGVEAPAMPGCLFFCGESMPRWILRLQCFDALRDVAVVDVRAVDFHEVGERFLLVARSLMGAGEFIVDGQLALLVDVLHVQRLLVPFHGGHRHAFFHEA